MVSKYLKVRAPRLSSFVWCLMDFDLCLFKPLKTSGATWPRDHLIALFVPIRTLDSYQRYCCLNCPQTFCKSLSQKHMTAFPAPLGIEGCLNVCSPAFEKCFWCWTGGDDASQMILFSVAAECPK